MSDVPSDGPARLGFVCVRNAGRSQMAAAFAEREVARRGLADRVEIVTGGTHPADGVHDGVIAAMADVGIDVADRTPRDVSTAEIERCDLVATMGCSTLDLDAAVDVRDWDLADPGEGDPEEVAAIRDEIEERVVALFDERFDEQFDERSGDTGADATTGEDVASGGV